MKSRHLNSSLSINLFMQLPPRIMEAWIIVASWIVTCKVPRRHLEFKEPLFFLKLLWGPSIVQQVDLERQRETGRLNDREWETTENRRFGSAVKQVLCSVTLTSMLVCYQFQVLRPTVSKKPLNGTSTNFDLQVIYTFGSKTGWVIEGTKKYGSASAERVTSGATQVLFLDWYHS